MRPPNDPSFGVLIWSKQKAVFFAIGQVNGSAWASGVETVEGSSKRGCTKQ
jgi:hypothetical protein